MLNSKYICNSEDNKSSVISANLMQILNNNQFSRKYLILHFVAGEFSFDVELLLLDDLKIEINTLC